MASVRLSVGLCIVLVVGALAAVPTAVTAQEDQVTLTVTVVDQNGDTLGGVPISATWNDGADGPVNETTAANGRAFVDVPEGANVSISIEDDEYIRNSPYEVEDASTQEINVTVSQSATATINVNNTEGNPVEDARVFLRRSGDFVTNQRTDADGTVTTPAVEEGNYTVDIRRSGYFYNQTAATITGDATVNRTIESGTVSMTVNVTDDHFQPPQAIEGASVELPSIGTTLQTLSNGQRTTNVPVNTQYDVEVSADGYATAEQSVQIDEQDTTVNLSIQRTAELNVDAPTQAVVGQSVELRVTDEYNETVPNATVTQGGEQVGTTDADGEVDVTVPSAGPVNFTVDDGTAQTTYTVEGFDPDATDIPENLTTETPTASATATSGGSGPGFTAVSVAAAVALLSLVALRRRE